MPRLDQALQLLAQGEFVCPYRFPDAFETIEQTDGRIRAEAWLGAIGYRLCQLEAGGAYFMAYAQADQDMRTQVREEMSTIRYKLHPAVQFLETIRQAQAGSGHLQPGDTVSLSEIIEAVRTSTVLERRMEGLKDLRGARVDDKGVDRVDRMLKSLQAEGYLHLSNEDLKIYTITGKIGYLYQLLSFLNDHTELMAEGEVEDALDEAKQLPLASSPTGAPAE